MKASPSGIEWIAALIAPWTISSHPNFSDPSKSDAADLALITEGRASRETSKRTDKPAWSRQLETNALGLLASNTIASAVGELAELSGRTDLPYGARSAAALLCSVGYADLDQGATAIKMLTSLTLEVRDTKVMPSSSLLAAAFVSQQAALRAYDIGQRDDALSFTRTARHYLSAMREGKLDTFPVSPGISWYSKRVQLDMRDALSKTIDASVATLESSNFGSWQRLVRSRSGWMATRAIQQERNRDNIVLRDAFESRFEALSGRRHFGRQGAVPAAYIAAFQAELSGDFARTRSNREAAGKIIALESTHSIDNALNSIRLLRRARADKPLQTILNRLRNDGPSVALVEESKRILLESEAAPTRESLMVLEYAAEFLSPAMLSSAIDFALQYSTQPGSAYVADWSIEEVSWRTISRLIEGSNRDFDIVDNINKRVSLRAPIPQPLADRISESLTKTDWKNIPLELAMDLVDKLGANQSPDLNSIRQTARSKAGLGQLPDQSPIDQAIRLINSGGPVDERELASSRAYLASSVESEVSDAQAGRYSIGVVPVVDVAVAFAARFEDALIWDSVGTALASGVLHPMQRDSALDRLAAVGRRIPRRIRDLFEKKARSLIERDGTATTFDDSALSLDSAMLRAGAAMGVVSPDEALQYCLRLSTESVAGKLEAAKTLPFCRRSDSTAVEVMLLQLSYETDPEVRAEAGYGLVVCSNMDSSVAPLIADRATELIRADGVRVPLRSLHGLQFLQQQGIPLPARLYAAAQEAAEPSRSARVVRAAARRVLSGEFEI